MVKLWTLVGAIGAWTAVMATGADAGSSTTTEQSSCDLIKVFSLVKPLEASEDVKKCIAATGYQLFPPPAAPSKEQVTKLCENQSCRAVFAALQKLDIPDCSISILGGVNMKKVIGEAFGQCGGGSSGGKKDEPKPSSSSPAPAPSPSPSVKPAGDKPTTTPVTTSSPATMTPAAKPTQAPPSNTTPVPTKAPIPPPTSPGNAKLPDPTPAPTPAGSDAKGKKLCHS